MRSEALHLRKGREAEERALTLLTAQGLRLVTRNYRCRVGEIDLIMDDGGTLVLVEVRYRANGRFGDALESITARKRARVIRCAEHYLSTRSVERPIRFDVVAITADERSPSMTWIRDAFQAG